VTPESACASIDPAPAADLLNGRLTVTFESLGRDIPQRLTTEGFLLRPIGAADTELDYAAVMESRGYLRTWEQSTWPADDFTVAANREDLEGLERRHADGRAFTFTVLDPARAECLGCVYVMPTDAKMFVGARVTPIGDHRWEDYQAAIYFWVRRTRLASQLDRVLLDTLRIWFAQDWHLDGHLFVTNEQFTQQVRQFGDTDLQLRFRVAEVGKPGRYVAYE